MKFVKLLLIIFFAIAALGTMAFVGNAHSNGPNNKDNGFAVVELFTSEGCSSCPPADELAAKIQKETGDKPVYILAYHVDYWNRLGWKDPFSSAEFSDRQRMYAHNLKLSSVYTPQIVVNGKKEFIGSEEGTLCNAIKGALQSPSSVQLSISVAAIKPGTATLNYKTGNADNAVLEIAVLQKNATTKVERGENSGRTLSHVQIVRKLKSVTLPSNSGSIDVALPRGYNTREWEIIGFLQNRQNGNILSACRAPLNGENIRAIAAK